MQPHVALPVLAHGVAVFTVPFHPAGRKITDLIPALAQIPRFGDQFGRGDGRILIDRVEESAQLVYVLQFAGERGSQIEAKPIDVHLRDPVAQAVHHELYRMRVHHVERVAATGIIHVMARVARHGSVVSEIVDAAERQGRPRMIAFGRVVVNHVQYDLDAAIVQILDHLLELANDVDAQMRVAGVAGLGREEPQRVIAPVVAQPPVDQMTIVHKVMHRHQLDGGDAQFLQVLDDRRRCDTGVGAAQLLGHVGMQHGHAAHVRFVDDRLVRLVGRTVLAGPIECRIDDRRQRRERRTVAVVEGQIAVRMSQGVAEQLVRPLELASYRLRVGVEQQFVRIETQAPGGLVRSVHPVPVQLAGRDVRQIDVPGAAGALANAYSLLAAAGLVEETQLHRIGTLGEQREVHSTAIPGRT